MEHFNTTHEECEDIYYDEKFNYIVKTTLTVLRLFSLEAATRGVI